MSTHAGEIAAKASRKVFEEQFEEAELSAIPTRLLE
jgi:hypothetical protein